MLFLFMRSARYSSVPFKSTPNKPYRMQEQDLPLTTPFKNIALALSGGGFRAASFSLGTLSYLERLKLEYDENGNPQQSSLLDHVSFIASASGGTITATVYSMLRHKKVPFPTIYKSLLNSINGEVLLNLALETLNDSTKWDQPGNYKRRNLINAFARAYDEVLFKGETFGVYWEEGAKDLEICFNSTEFCRGLQFRFQTDGDSKTFELIGNRYIHFDRRKLDTYKYLKLADILAASSCFPGGFEPIVFPEDFSYADRYGTLLPDQLRDAISQEHYDKTITPLQGSIGLMDGGITDNQGLDSTLLADERRRRNNAKEFDLIIVTDVSSYYMGPFKVPEESEGPAWKKKTLSDYFSLAKKIPSRIRMALIISILVLLGSLATIFFVKDPAFKNIGYIVLGISATTTFILSYLLRLKNKLGLSTMLDRKFDLAGVLKKNIPTIRNFSDVVINRLALFLKETRLGVLHQMLLSRLNSVLTMVSDINLKHVRRLIYGKLYVDSKWDNRRCANFIYELSQQNAESRKRTLTDYVNEGKLTAQDIQLLTPSPKILEAAEAARLVGTTLWYDSGNKTSLKDVVSCGQFSTCVNLLQYILEIQKDRSLNFSEPVKKNLTGIKEKLISDWNHFNDNPYFLYEQLDK